MRRQAVKHNNFVIGRPGDAAKPQAGALKYVDGKARRWRPLARQNLTCIRNRDARFGGKLSRRRSCVHAF